MNRVAIVSAKRSPIGSFGGSLKNVSAAALGSAVVQDALNNINLDPSLVDEVIFGNVLQAGLGQNIARQIAVNAGIPKGKKCVYCQQSLRIRIKECYLRSTSYSTRR